MTREEKLAYHLEMVIWEDQPEGATFGTVAIKRMMAAATPEQRQRAYQMALTHSPMLLEDER